jgi:hypothetical protein
VATFPTKVPVICILAILPNCIFRFKKRPVLVRHPKQYEVTAEYNAITSGIKKHSRSATPQSRRHPARKLK